MNSSDYYRFDDRRRAFSEFQPDTPQAWINYLSNGIMHAFVSQAGGGCYNKPHLWPAVILEE